MREIVQEGNLGALRTYVDENRSDLEARRDRDHEEAKAEAKRVVPMTNSEWVSWMESNGQHYHDVMQSAPQSRKQVSQRLFATEALARTSRIYPVYSSSVFPTWVRKMMHQDAGTFVIKFGPRADEKVVFYSATLRYHPWGFHLEEEADNAFNHNTHRQKKQENIKVNYN